MVIAQIGDYENHQYRRAAVKEAPRQIHSGSFHLSSNKRYDVPALISPQDGNQRDRKPRERKNMPASSSSRLKKLDWTRPFDAQQEDDPGQSADFGDSNQVLR